MGAKTASQTGDEGEPGDEVSGTPVREVSKVPEGQEVSLCLGEGGPWASVPPLGAYFHSSLSVKELRHYLGHIWVISSSMVLCTCARLDQ